MNDVSSTMVGDLTTSSVGAETAARSAKSKAATTKKSRGRRSENEKSESTRDALLRVMVHTLDECGEPGVRLEKVLREAKASVSSMYHHFGNLAGLIEAAHVVRFRRTQQLDVEYFTEEMKLVKNLNEFRDLLTRAMDRAFHENRRIVRSQRVNASARSYQNPQYAEFLRDLQRQANQALILALLQAQAKGFIPSHVDIEAAAAWWTSTIYGRYFVEILDDADLESRWNELARRMAFEVLDIAE